MNVVYTHGGMPIGCGHDHPATLRRVICSSAVALAGVAMIGSMLVQPDHAPVLIAQGGFAGVFGVAGLVQFWWQQRQTLARQDPRHLKALEELVREAQAQGVEIEPLPCDDPRQMTNRQLRRWHGVLMTNLALTCAGSLLAISSQRQQRHIDRQRLVPMRGQSVKGVLG